VAASQEVRALVAAETANANGDAAEAERRALGDWIRDAAGSRAGHQDRRVFTTIFRRYASGGDADTSSRCQHLTGTLLPHTGQPPMLVDTARADTAGKDAAR
jgi:hypothetical protein